MEATQLTFWEGIDMKSIKQRADELRRRNRAQSTQLCYANDWTHFDDWCKTAGRVALPASAETVALYATAACALHRPATIRRRIAAIRFHHTSQQLPPPDTRDASTIVSGFERSGEAAPSQAKDALTVDQLTQISRRLEAKGTPQAIRDRAIMVFGFASAMRRSELAALTIGDLTLGPKGMAVKIPRSKTDQAGQGRTIGIFRARTRDLCPIRALRAWIRIRGRWTGPLFTAANGDGSIRKTGITGPAVAYTVKRCAALIGLEANTIGAHSLRAGMVTAALESGAPELTIMRRTGHKDRKTLDPYFRPASAFSHDPLAKAI